MDVLVLWEDGSKNVVASTDLKLIKGKAIIEGSKIKMFYGTKWYKGTVLAVEELSETDFSENSDDNKPSNELFNRLPSSGSSDDNMPLSELRRIINNDHRVLPTNVYEKKTNIRPPKGSPTPQHGICGVAGCNQEVFSACHRCLVFLCWDHFIEETNNCSEHGNKAPWKKPNADSLQTDEEIKLEEYVKTVRPKINILQNIIVTPPDNDQNSDGNIEKPETFVVEGEKREGSDIYRLPRINKQKEAKKLRNLGKQYISATTKKLVPGRSIGTRCDIKKCKRAKKLCAKISDEDRKNIFDDYYKLGDLTKQRNFLIKHIIIKNIKRRTTGNVPSRRQHTLEYTFTIEKETYLVCRKFFLNTLGISEKTCRTALSKVSKVGVLQEEQRGGRQRKKKILLLEKKVRLDIQEHINRFPKVESHYCRSNNTKLYLHPDLSLRKMYSMFKEECRVKKHYNPPSFSTYERIFKKSNLAFLRPKKDQCTLCVAFREGNEGEKNQLRQKFEKHNVEKIKAREKKNEYKELAKENQSVLCGVFDLQQVIFLPISRDSSIFYKSRLNAYNFTFYDVASKDCFCFLWHEAISKRGASEISTCVFRILQRYSDKDIKEVYLFADGCPGQNKNTLTAAMLLYSVQKFPTLEKISLSFFETNHGQNEGDSAHSAISRAIKASGEVIIPGQLQPIIRLARRYQPYNVIAMNSKDFKDFKILSTKLRILKVRNSDKGKNVNWRNIKEILVSKSDPLKIFFKGSHLDKEYDSITLKRLNTGIMNLHLQDLNETPPKISKNKFKDLSSLCKGEPPVVRLPEFQKFFMSLPHEN